MATNNEADDWRQLEESVDEVCRIVFDAANDVLKSVEILGFENLLDGPKPTPEDKMEQVKLLDSLFSALTSFFERTEKNDLAMKMINTRQQILRLELLITAVKRRDFEECRTLADSIKNQRYV